MKTAIALLSFAMLAGTVNAAPPQTTTSVTSVPATQNSNPSLSGNPSAVRQGSPSNFGNPDDPSPPSGEAGSPGINPNGSNAAQSPNGNNGAGSPNGNNAAQSPDGGDSNLIPNGNNKAKSPTSVNPAVTSFDK